MRFKLTYQGELRSTQKNDPASQEKSTLSKHKHDIRKKFYQQLKEFWKLNKFLSSYKADALTDYKLSPIHYSSIWDDGPTSGAIPLAELVAREYVENGFRFAPLVRRDASLTCALEIMFLRRDHPENGVLNAGDLDNRVKTIIDCLTKPNGKTQLADFCLDQNEDPFFCLLEDDKLVTGLSVESGLLLTPSENQFHSQSYSREVILLISVEIKPYNITMFNLGFA